MNRIKLVGIKNYLEDLYHRYNRREFIHPDPLEFVYRYNDPRDRELAGFVAAALAFGQVGQILKDVERALAPMNPSPYATLLEARPKWLNESFAGFQHRWTTGKELATLWLSLQRVCRRHGSLQKCFLTGFRRDQPDVMPALVRFIAELEPSGQPGNSLLPRPERGSACKRLHMFLRWMVRQDEIDPGGWSEVPPSKLIAPLDTHMYRISKSLKFTRRGQANLKTALEVTAAFRRIAPEDPVRYDFALTRLGMRGEGEDTPGWAHLV